VKFSPKEIQMGTQFRRYPRQRFQRTTIVWPRNIARIAIVDGGLAALNQGDGQAYLATCDPGTVSSRPAAGTPLSTSALRGISYADGSVWQQTVTVTFHSQGKPVADRTNLGTELLIPTGG
jgi:hypothetical protein